MIEEDTFKALQRTPYNEVMSVLADNYATHQTNNEQQYMKKMNKLLAPHYWTYDELVEEHKKHQSHKGLRK